MDFEIIETERLILKGLSPENMKVIFETNSKADIKKILGHRSEEDYLREENKHKNGYSCYNRSFMLFLIKDKTSGEIIGRCGIHNWNRDHRRAEIGYVMENEAYRQKGMMREALATVIDYGFGSMNLHRLEALAGTENMASLRLLEKFGFIKEGLLRQHYPIGEGYTDSLMLSILREEYMNSKEKNKPKI